MKKLLIALCLTCALALTANAGGKGKKHELTDEQKTVHKDMLAKYDANKDGKLDKEEKAKMSAEDKDKMQKAFPRHKKGEGEAKTETK
ncbi:MAG: hypothetical protein MUF81_18740 [Verrucomicrobia bacterium]|nr:hypothetical protein [Verrucomicrobiota bacterium]